MTPPYTDPVDRDQAWRELGALSAFGSFFIGDVLQKRIADIEKEIVETCPPERLLEMRAVRNALKETQRSARHELQRTKTVS